MTKNNNPPLLNSPKGVGRGGGRVVVVVVGGGGTVHLCTVRQYVQVVVVDRFYIALFSALEQTHCAHTQVFRTAAFSPDTGRTSVSVLRRFEPSIAGVRAWSVDH